MKNNKIILKSLFNDIFSNRDYSEAMVAKYFDASYLQEVDGEELNYQQFCKHIIVQKETVASMTFDFQTLIEEADVLFSNHIVMVGMKNGQISKFRVLAEFHFSAGKVIYCNELTHMISGNSENKDLGSRR